jgi:hypothetical protein
MQLAINFIIRKYEKLLQNIKKKETNWNFFLAIAKSSRVEIVYELKPEVLLLVMWLDS